ncbi:MAG: polysulfide reductase NrfD, partial [Myxococcales bacterium]|nr:polysulfide reductase NrfD [Myxococcales bacterium]
SGNPYEWHVFRWNRLGIGDATKMGSLWWSYWAMIFCNVVVPQTFWFKRLRTSLPWMFVASILINIGMWFERFVIIATSLHRDFLPSSWGYFAPTLVDICLYLGTFGLFFTLFLLFIRWVPMVAMAEVKMALPQADPHHGEPSVHEGHGGHVTAAAQPTPAE